MNIANSIKEKAKNKKGTIAGVFSGVITNAYALKSSFYRPNIS